MIVNNNQPADAVHLNAQSNLDQTRALSRKAGGDASTDATFGSQAGDDSIALSNSPALVHLALSTSSPERSARTQELKALVQSDQYHPDAQELSSALVDAHLTGE